MAISTFKVNTSVSIPVAGGSISPIDLKVMPARVNGRVCQVNSFMLRFNLGVASATTAVAVTPYDLLQLFQIKLVRNGSTSRINCSAWDLFCRDALFSGGIPSVTMPAAIAANHNATTNLVLCVPISFAHRGLAEFRTATMPAEAYRQSGRVEVTMAQPSTIGVGISMVSATVDCIAVLDTVDEAIFGADSEVVSYQSNSTTGTEFQFDPSVPGYVILAANAYKYQTGENFVTSLTAVDGSKYDQRFAPLSGAEIRDLYVLGCNVDTTAGVGVNVVNLGLVSPVIAPSMGYGQAQLSHSRYSAGKYFKLIFNYTGLAQGERYLVERIVPRDNNEVASVLQRLGINPQTVDTQFLNGVPAAGRQDLVAVKAVPGTGRVARPRQRGTAG